MSKIQTFKNLMKGDKRRILIALYNNIIHTNITNILPDKAFLMLTYRITFGERLNLNSPKTFNEKLQWLKLYNRQPEYQKMVDKYEAKQYVASVIGEEYIIPTLGVWNSFDEIDFDTLPNQFVLKCTHDSGSVVICRDKASFDKAGAKSKIEKGLKNDLFWYGREWPYKGLKRRIIAEQYMEDTSTSELRDYKFFCFNGQAKCYKVDFDRFIEHHANYYDMENNLLKFGEIVCPPDFNRKIECPKTIDKMKELAEKLSQEQPFLRADFYDVDGKIYFGELTFYPASGFGPFMPKEWDLKLGEWLAMPNYGGSDIH